MSFFSKNKKENGGFTVNTEDIYENSDKNFGTKNSAPHAITPDEVSALWVFGDEENTSNNNALDSLKKRMNLQSQSATDTKPDGNVSVSEENKNTDENTDKNVNKPESISPKAVDTPNRKTLLEKLSRYTVDEEGHDFSKNDEPLYQLETVAEILKSNSENTIKNLSKKYDIFVDDLKKDKKSDNEVPQKNVDFNSDTNSTETVPTTAFKQMVNDSEKHEEKQLYESLFEPETYTEPSKPDFDIPDISDLDNREFGVKKEQNIADTSTIRFMPIKDLKGNTDHISISSVTKHIDLDDTLIEKNDVTVSDTVLEKSEFEKFEPDNEITDIASGKKMLRLFAFKKRSAFLSVFVSTIAVIALLTFFIPSLSDFIIAMPRTAMIICGAFLAVSVIANANMFCAIFKPLKKSCSPDHFASFASVFTLAVTVCATLTYSNAYYVVLSCAIMLFLRALSQFKYTSATHGNLKQLLKNTEKNAVTLIDDTATTFAMTKNTIEGDALICTHKKAGFVKDFIKYSTFDLNVSSKLPIIFLASVILAVFSAVTAYFYYQNIFTAFYSASTISLISAIPTLFFINSFALSSSAKKLNQKSSFIAGIHGAKAIENANAVVVSTNDIFPENTVTMYSMKVLSNNSIDETILKAAALTAELGSPLEAIFKQIAGTNTSYSIPDADTVKYEKRLGISGWVDNELLFIGNRSLMEAHGIQIPSIEIDKKILRRGYFPVYLATENTACALIVIQYDVRQDIAKELRKITELGITLLVENCDPNINEEMLCDYFGLYEDSVKIMSNAGVYMHKNATEFTEECSAPAVFSGSPLNFLKIVNCASNIKKSNRILTVMYTVFWILGLVYFIYASFSGLHSMPQPFTIFMYELTVTILSIIGFLIRKP